MKILYFAWLREKAGRAEETVDVPPGVATVGALIDWLKGQGEGHKAAFADPSLVRVAVNQEYVKLDHPVRRGDEVAFFPPVTGG
ncbi:MAG: molybdopterin converting factor subunit 1 [Rhodospirillales bacterium]|nr:molybdopterin converting factor subunit 1 [Rhodospirillales bacterium]